MNSFKLIIITFLLVGLSFQANGQCEVLNGGFEAGDMSDWIVNDIASPFLPVSVSCVPGSIGFGFETVTALEGSCYTINGFDGAGPGEIAIHQEMTLPAGKNIQVEWSETIAYDLSTFGASIDRLFEVQVQPSGGGAPLEILYSFTAMAGTMELGTGWTTHTADLTAYAGQTIRFCFVETIPETFTGPGQVAIDGVSLTCTEIVPTMGEWGIMSLGLMMLIIGTVAVGQRRQTAIG